MQWLSMQFCCFPHYPSCKWQLKWRHSQWLNWYNSRFLFVDQKHYDITVGHITTIDKWHYYWRGQIKMSFCRIKAADTKHNETLFQKPGPGAGTGQHAALCGHGIPALQLPSHDCQHSWGISIKMSSTRCFCWQFHPVWDFLRMCRRWIIGLGRVRCQHQLRTSS